MMNRNNKVNIIPSAQLFDLKLPGLIGKTGIIVEDLSYEWRKNKGYMVLFPESFLEENVWFLPIESIQYEE